MKTLTENTTSLYIFEDDKYLDLAGNGKMKMKSAIKGLKTGFQIFSLRQS